MHLARTHRLLFAVIAALLCGCTVAFLGTGCSRLSNHEEDIQNVQGEWQVVGSLMTMVITENQIMLPNGTFYDYEIDTVNGTMEFSVGEVQGQATYHLGTDSATGVLMLTITETNSQGSQVTQLARLSDNVNALPTLDGGSLTFADVSDVSANVGQVPEEGTEQEGAEEPAAEENAPTEGGEAPSDPALEEALPEEAPEEVPEAA